jgi:hypothetical protein
MCCGCLAHAGEPRLCVELRRICAIYFRLPFLGGLVVVEGLVRSPPLSSAARVVVLQ